MKPSMKLAVLAAAALTLLAGGCGAAKNAPKDVPAPKAEAAAPAKAAPAGDKKMLIVYWSLSGGNTKRIADALQQATGADMEALELVTPYSGSYDDITAQGKREVDEGFKPELKPLRYEPEDYDVIAVGTPTWWYTMSPAVRSLPRRPRLDGEDRHSLPDPRGLARTLSGRYAGRLRRRGLRPSPAGEIRPSDPRLAPVRHRRLAGRRENRPLRRRERRRRL